MHQTPGLRPRANTSSFTSSAETSPDPLPSLLSWLLTLEDTDIPCQCHGAKDVHGQPQKGLDYLPGLFNTRSSPARAARGLLTRAVSEGWPLPGKGTAGGKQRWRSNCWRGCPQQDPGVPDPSSLQEMVAQTSVTLEFNV